MFHFFSRVFSAFPHVYLDYLGRRREAQAPGGAERAGIVYQSLREPYCPEETGDQLATQNSRLGVRRGDRAAEEAGHRLQGLTHLGYLFAHRVIPCF